MGCSKSKSTEQPKANPGIRVAQPESRTINDEFKVVFVGNAAVGKTSLVDKYIRGNFEDSYQVTIGGNY